MAAPRPTDPVHDLWCRGLDPTADLHRVFVDEFAPTWQLLTPALTPAPGNPATESSRAGRIQAWVRWAVLPRLDGGGGLARSAEDLATLGTRALQDGAWDWWCWLHEEVDADHPLVWAGDCIRDVGDRGTTAPVRRSTAQKAYRALRAWGAQVDVDDITRRIDRAEAGERPTPRPSKERIDLSTQALGAVIEVCNTQAVPLRIIDPVVRELWHLRQKATFLTQIKAVARISEVGALSPAQSHVQQTRDDDVPQLHIHLSRTKTTARDVVLEPTGTELCCLAAIEDFHRAATDAGLGDQLAASGLWLPGVVLNRRRGEPRIRPVTYQTERNNFLRVMRAAGQLTDEMEASGDLLLGTHAGRRVLPRAAQRAGWTLARVTRLGGGAWAPDSTAVLSYVGDDGPSIVSDVLGAT